MDALDAFLDWCDQTRCSLASAGSPRDLLQQLIARVDRGPVARDVHGQRRDPRGDAHAQPARERGAVDALRPFARLADPGRRPRPGGARGARARRCCSSPTSTSAGVPTGTWHAAGGGQRGHQLRRPSGEAEGAERPPPSWPTSPRSRPSSRRGAAPGRPTVCVGMPKPAKGDKLGDVQVRGAPPILVIGTTGDPATPYAGAQAMVARIAGSQLLTFDSTEHTAYGRGHQHVHRRRGRHVPRRRRDARAAGAHCAPD